MSIASRSAYYSYRSLSQYIFTYLHIKLYHEMSGTMERARCGGTHL